MCSAIAKTVLVVAGLFVLASLATGCNPLDYAPLASAESTLTEEFQFAKPVKIVAQTFNGTIDVSPSESSEVVVEVTKRAGGFDRQTAEANLEYVEVSMVQKDDAIVVTAQKVGSRSGNFGANVVIAAPAGSPLQLVSSNGHIVTEGMVGGIVAKSSNGKLEVYEGGGAIDLSTSNGPIAIEAKDAKVIARTSNGRVKFNGTLTAGKQTFKSSNGRIELAMPRDAQFQFEASTSNSRVKCGFPFEQKDGSKRGRRLSGQVGKDSACSIVAATSNGSIDIHPADATSDDGDN